MSLLTRTISTPLTTDNGKRLGQHKVQGLFIKISNPHQLDRILSDCTWLSGFKAFSQFITLLECGSTFHGYDIATQEAAYHNINYRHWYWYNI